MPCGLTMVGPAVGGLTIRQIAARAEQSHPGAIDQLGNLYAQHPTLVKTLGGAALAIVLAKVKDHLQA